MKYFDVSLHFTPKGQDVGKIFRAIDGWLEANPEIVDFSERGEGEPRTILHHCFMRRSDVEARGFDTTICDELETFSEDVVCWNGVSQGTITEDRLLMLENLKRLNGIALFSGDVIDGVKEELELAKEIGVSWRLISLPAETE